MKLETIIDKIDSAEVAVRVQVGRGLFAEITAEPGETAKLDEIVVQFGDQEVVSVGVDDCCLLIHTRRPE